jgi:hypothetical protein
MLIVFSVLVKDYFYRAGMNLRAGMPSVKHHFFQERLWNEHLPFLRNE